MVARHLVVLALPLLALGCAPRGSSSLPAASAHAAPGWEAGDHGVDRGVDAAPFFAELDGRWLGAGEAALEARVDVRRPLAAPLALTLRLPPGARLADGDARELLEPPKAGARVTRAWRVVGVAPGGRFAFTAEQSVPEREAANATVFWPPDEAAKPPTFGRVRPVRAGGVVVDEAIELTPKERTP
ncbi:MAG: hypothetical protein KC635_28370 [Myxococcales bacterium]|nr:hypothetical protein [Myxococcales bacterium]